MEYGINKGVGRSPEFKGLRAQYLYWGGGGMVILFVFNMVLYIAGINPYLWVVLSLSSAGLLVRLVFYMNDRFGQHGLTKLIASKLRPDVIINRGGLLRQLQYQAKKQKGGNNATGKSKYHR